MTLYLFAKELDMISDSQPRERAVSAGVWAALFVSAMLAAGVGARIADLDEFWSMAVMIPPMMLLIPMVRASNRSSAWYSAMTPALRRYNQRGLIWAFGYVIALFAAMTLHQNFALSGAAAFVVAALPALPIFYFLWAMARYLQEESDEFVRFRQVQASLVATGLVLALGTLWGFFETFGLVPHIWAWWVVPVWAIGLGIGNAVTLKERL
jgi:hypothetical protein